jgi:alpha-L-fucosidase 2
MLENLLTLTGSPRTEYNGGGVYANLFDAHPPFQIDGNFGATSGIVEMLVQDQTGEIELLPALPSAWPDGSVHGLRLRGGFDLDMEWRAGRLVEAVLTSRLGNTARVRSGNTVQEYPTEIGQRIVLQSN